MVGVLVDRRFRHATEIQCAPDERNVTARQIAERQRRILLRAKGKKPVPLQVFPGCIAYGQAACV